MDILNKIIAHKRTEVENRKSLFPQALLEQSIFFETPTVSMKKYLNRTDKSGIIAEFKRKSPSKGMINSFAEVEKVSIGYMQAGASALSVLTDEHFFGGKNEDLRQARKFNYCPVLRKDFIIDEYQIIEAKAIGADVILLIAAHLSKADVLKFSTLAKELGMEILFEIHAIEELEKLNGKIDLIGVNNRNLKTFEVNIDTSLQLAAAIPNECIKVSESGISEAEKVIRLKEEGFKGFLIGEHFMKSADPGKKCLQFVQEIQNLASKGIKDSIKV